MPRHKENDPTQMPLGQPADIILSDSNGAVGVTSIEAIDKPLHDSYLAELAFMDETIAIVVAESTDKNAEDPVRVGVNGVFAHFWRGKPTATKRKFVDALIVKNMSITTPEYINGGGERAFKIEQKNALKFPFMVLNEKSPRGREWLARRMAEIV